MKISNANLQIYQVGKTTPQDRLSRNPETKPNKLAGARFAELLDSGEKEFISSNFKSQPADNSADKALGRFLDVVA